LTEAYREDPYLTILQQCPVPVVVHQDGVLVFANRATYEVFGFDPDRTADGIGTVNVFDFVAEEERDDARANQERMLATGETQRNVQRVVLDRSGKRHLALCSGSVIAWRGRPALEVSVVLLDHPSSEEPRVQGTEVLKSLTERELQVALLVTRGKSTSNIAAALNITEWTVRTMLRAIYKKTGTHARIDLARLVMGFRADP